jgi:hypothetical protein
VAVSSAAAAAAAVLNKDADEEVATPGWKTFKNYDKLIIKIFNKN